MLSQTFTVSLTILQFIFPTHLVLVNSFTPLHRKINVNVVEVQSTLSSSSSLNAKGFGSSPSGGTIVNKEDAKRKNTIDGFEQWAKGVDIL